MNIGGAIKQLRIKKDISQQELSSRCNISQAALSQFENGIKVPGKKTLKCICSELGVTESLLLVLSIDDSDVPKENKLIYEKLFPEVKEMILKIIDKK